jgi:hypothetical protein
MYICVAVTVLNNKGSRPSDSDPSPAKKKSVKKATNGKPVKTDIKVGAKKTAAAKTSGRGKK